MSRVTRATPHPEAADDRWSNWAGNVIARPVRCESPSTVGEIAESIRRAASDGLRVKCVGAGHSFTPVAVTDGVSICVDALSGIEAIVPRRGADGRMDGADVTVWAGTRMHRLGPLLWDLGLALPNLGDIDRQTLAGALSTGTHGTGMCHGGLPTAVVGLQLVTADGSVLDCDREHHREVFEVGRLGIGAIGVLSKITLRCVPAFALRAVEEPGRLSAVIDDLEHLAVEADHVEFYWFPHSDVISVKRNTRLPGDTDLAPLGRLRRYLDDELLVNSVFGAVCRSFATRPRLSPAVNRITSRLRGSRSFTDRSYTVFASPRRVRFHEMEYAVPIEAAGSVLRDLRTYFRAERVPTLFPVEVRFAPDDDVWLSPSYRRDVCYIAVHQYVGMDHTDYFARAEATFLAAGGRPHWGKLHTRTAGDFRSLYPRFDEVVAVRDRIDPDRVFTNGHLGRILPC